MEKKEKEFVKERGEEALVDGRQLWLDLWKGSLRSHRTGTPEKAPSP